MREKTAEAETDNKHVQPLVRLPMRPAMSVCMNTTDYQKQLIAWQRLRIEQLETALNDLLNDCINFDGGKLSDCYLKQASEAMKAI